MQLRGKVMSSAAEFNATGAENEVPKSDEKSHTEELAAVLKNIQVELKISRSRLSLKTCVESWKINVTGSWSDST